MERTPNALKARPLLHRVTAESLILLIRSCYSLTLRAARPCHGLTRLLPRSLTLSGLPIYVARFPAAPLAVRSIDELAPAHSHSMLGSISLCRRRLDSR